MRFQNSGGQEVALKGQRHIYCEGQKNAQAFRMSLPTEVFGYGQLVTVFLRMNT